MAENLEQSYREGIPKGIEREMQAGIRKGQASIILSLLSGHFGDLPGEVVQRVRQADSDDLARWALAFRSAESLDDVFSNGAGNGHGSNGRSGDH